MIDFRVKLTADDNDTVLVTCPDLLMVATFGSDEADALHHSVDAIETVIASLIASGDEIPKPNSRSGHAVRLPLRTALKLQLYWALGETGITRAELARRLEWNRESVDRLFRLDHRSRLEQIEAAFKAMGRDVSVEIRPAA